MKTKTALAALVLALAPALAPSFAFAACESDHAQMICAEGTVWDAETARCVAPTG